MSDLLDAFLAGDTDRAIALLAPEAEFHSPVADYRGPETIAAVWGALARVMGPVTATTTLRDEHQTVAFFAATVQDREIDGVVRVVGEPGAPVTDVTLMIRPLAALLKGIEQMKAELQPAGRASPIQ